MSASFCNQIPPLVTTVNQRIDLFHCKNCDREVTEETARFPPCGCCLCNSCSKDMIGVYHEETNKFELYEGHFIKGPDGVFKDKKPVPGVYYCLCCGNAVGSDLKDGRPGVQKWAHTTTDEQRDMVLSSKANGFVERGNEFEKMMDNCRFCNETAKWVDQFHVPYCDDHHKHFEGKEMNLKFTKIDDKYNTNFEMMICEEHGLEACFITEEGKYQCPLCIAKNKENPGMLPEDYVEMKREEVEGVKDMSAREIVKHHAYSQGYTSRVENVHTRKAAIDEDIEEKREELLDKNDDTIYSLRKKNEDESEKARKEEEERIKKDKELLIKLCAMEEAIEYLTQVIQDTSKQDLKTVTAAYGALKKAESIIKEYDEYSQGRNDEFKIPSFTGEVVKVNTVDTEIIEAPEIVSVDRNGKEVTVEIEFSDELEWNECLIRWAKYTPNELVTEFNEEIHNLDANDDPIEVTFEAIEDEPIILEIVPILDGKHGTPTDRIHVKPKEDDYVAYTPLSKLDTKE